MIKKLNPTVLALEPSGIRRITQMAREIPDCVYLTIGEPDGDMPEAVRDDIIASLRAGDTHYPPNTGIAALCAAIAAHTNEKHGTAYTPDCAIVTNGSTEAIATALMGILSQGDEVIVPVPSFGLYDSLIRLAGGKVVHLHSEKDGFQIRRHALEACMSDRTKAILFASPNNPTGLIYDAESLALMKEAALSRDLFLLLDAVYDELVYEPDMPHLARALSLREHLIVLQSFSKPYAMTGARIGYLLSDGAIAQQLLKVHAALTVGTATFIQQGCVNIFDVPLEEMRLKYRARRDKVLGRLTQMGMDFHSPQGAFYVFPSVAKYGMDAGTFVYRLMNEQKLALIPSTCFGVDGYVRLSYCYDDATLEKGLDRLEQFVSGLETYAD